MAEQGNPLVATVDGGSWTGTANTQSLTYAEGSRQGQFNTDALSKDTEGAGLFSDAASTIGDAASGNWGGLAVDAVGDGMDLLGMAMDPFGSLLGAGIGWLIEHIGFLKKALDIVAGDPEAVTAKSQTWTNVAKALTDAASQYQRSAASLASSNQGTAVSGAAATGKNLSVVLQGAAQHATDAATAMKLAATAVGTTRGVIRDTLSQFAGDAIVKWIAATAAAFFTFGATEAAFVVDEVAEGASVAAQNAGKISELLKVLEKFKGGAKDSENTLKTAASDLDKGAKHTGSVGHDASTAESSAAHSPTSGESSAPHSSASGESSAAHDSNGAGGESTTPQHYWQKKEEGPSHEEVDQHVDQHKQAVDQHNQQVAQHNQNADRLKQDTEAHNAQALANQHRLDANRHALDMNQQAINRARAQGRPHDSLNAQHRSLTDERKSLMQEDQRLGQRQQDLTQRQQDLQGEGARLNEQATGLQAKQQTLAREKGDDMLRQGSLQNASLEGNRLVNGLGTANKIWEGPIEGLHLGDMIKEPFAQGLSDQETRSDAVGYESATKQEAARNEPAWPTSEH